MLTTFGPVPLTGRLTSKTRPLLFVVRGSFPVRDHLVSLSERLPEADVILVHLPGMHSPFFADSSPVTFAAAFDEILAELAYERVATLGISVGGVVAMAMKHPAIKRSVLVDTPLTTAELWPLVAEYRRISAERLDGAAWIQSLFGIYSDRIEERDYRPLLAALRVPTTALIGSDDLGMPREFSRTPSLVSEADRALYSASSWVEPVVVEDVGHNIPAERLGAMMTAVRNALGAGDMATGRASA
jgi:pimeloyl-ACP methyl ester carboxylesterase